MKIARSFSFGFRWAVTQPRMILRLYVINLLLAVPTALALRSVLDSGLGESLGRTRLMAGLDFTVFMDFMNAHGQQVGALLTQCWWLIALVMLLSSFLAGGILSRLGETEVDNPAQAFFAGCARYFGRFFRLFLIFGVLLLVVTLVVGGLVSALGDAMTENATSEITFYWVRLVSQVVVLKAMMFVVVMADYAKIAVVVHDERSALMAAWQSLRFVFRHLLSVVGLELLLVVPPLLLFGVYLVVDLSMGATSGFTIVVIFVLQQVFVFSRFWTRAFFFGSEFALYHNLHLPHPVAEAFQVKATNVDPAAI